MSPALKLLTAALGILWLASGPEPRNQASATMPDPSLPRNLTLRHDDGTVTINPRGPFGGRMGAGEGHPYAMPLNAGQYVRVVAQQDGIDLSLRLPAPGGEPVIEIDTPTGTSGPETLHAIAEESGTYTVEVKALASDPEAVGYRGRREVLREAKADDHVRVAAQGAFFAAVAVAASDDPDAGPRALATYGEALAHAQKISDPYWEGWTLYNMARIRQQQGDYGAALEDFRQALTRLRELPERRPTAVVLNRIGSLERRFAEVDQALDAYSQALAIFRETGRRAGEASCLNNVANVHKSAGELEHALHTYREALNLSIEEGKAEGQAVVRLNMGEILASLEQLPEAVDTLQKALELSRRIGSRRLETLVRNGLARVFYRQDEPQKALDQLTEALAIAREERICRAIPLSLLRLGNACLRLDRHDEAGDAYEEALGLFRHGGERQGEAAALASLGRLEDVRGRCTEAQNYLNEAQELFRHVGDHSGEASTLFASAQALYHCGRLDEARDRIRAAVEGVELLRSESRSPELRSSYFASRQEYYDLYLDVLMDLARERPGTDHELEAFRVGEQRRARGLLDSLAEARSKIHLDADPTLLAEKERLQRQLNAAASQRRMLEERGEASEIEVLEKKQRELLVRFKELQGRIRRTSHRYGSLVHPEPLAAAQVQTELLDDQTILLAYGFGQEKCFLWLVATREIDHFVIPERGEIEKLGRLLHKSWSAGGPINEVVGRGYAWRLSERLLKPVADKLGQKRLVIVGEGVLALIPFAALPDPASGDGPPVPLVARHEIIRLPSASVLPALRRQRRERPAPAGLVGVLADPVFSPDDPRVRVSETATPRSASGSGPPPPGELSRSARDVGLYGFERLPATRVEAETIIELARGKGFQALDFDASRETVLSGRLKDYRIVHLAGHGLLNTEHPELSGLVLSLVTETGEERNGFLRVHEIYELELGADLVTLSACKTGLGKEIRGEGIVGLTQAFLYAGATRVAVSLWDVSDQVTAELMAELYRGIIERGRSPAAALRAAQLSMLGDQDPWEAPKHWAAFVVYGDWR